MITNNTLYSANSGDNSILIFNNASGLPDNTDLTPDRIIKGARTRLSSPDALARGFRKQPAICLKRNKQPGSCL